MVDLDKVRKAARDETALNDSKNHNDRRRYNVCAVFGGYCAVSAHSLDDERYDGNTPWTWCLVSIGAVSRTFKPVVIIGRFASATQLFFHGREAGTNRTRRSYRQSALAV